MNERASYLDEVIFGLVDRLFPDVDPGSLTTILITILIATLVSLILILLIRGLTGFIEKKLLSVHIGKSRPIRIQNLDILTGEQIARGVGKLFVWIRYLGYVIIFYLYVNLVFSFFAVTRGISTTLLDHFIKTVGFIFGAIIGYIPNLVTLIVIFAIGIYIIRLTKVFFRGVKEERIRISGFYPDWADPTFTIARFFIIAFLVVVAFPYLPGKESPAFQAVSIFLGVLVSLGSTGAVSNVVAGIALTYMRAFKKGDRVKIADTVGDVVEKSMFVTRIRTIKNVEITVPNAMVLNNHIINYSALAQEQGLILHSKVTIGYDVPWQRVHDLLIKAAEATEDIQESPKPFVLQTALDDFYVEYEINAYTKNPGRMALIYNDLHRNIQDRFHEAGVEIASPGIMALRDGSKEYIPDDYLPKDYKPAKSGIWPLGARPGEPEDK